MQFITHRRFRGNGLEGHENIPALTVLEARDGKESGFAGELLYHEGRAVCAPFSDTGTRHFAPNDDGMGMRRGALTWAIAHAERRSDRPGARFSEAECDLLFSEYGHWLMESVDGYINFNNAFFSAPVEELEKLAARLGIRVRR